MKIGDFKIGVIHGHQVIPWGDIESLSAIRRELDCDVIISGHTHKNSVTKYEGKYFINPGSVTGAYTPLYRFFYFSDINPSFDLMVIKGETAALFVYEWIDGQEKVLKSNISKNEPNLVSSPSHVKENENSKDEETKS